MKQCPFSIQCRDSNPWPLERESLPITTRPGLPPIIRNVCSLKSCGFYLRINFTGHQRSFLVIVSQDKTFYYRVDLWGRAVSQKERLAHSTNQFDSLSWQTSWFFSRDLPAVTQSLFWISLKDLLHMSHMSSIFWFRLLLIIAENS